jgi:2,3-dihydroxy-p-cumate/2,3-dihydroxybenzoate 3,4-dioxygenase
MTHPIRYSRLGYCRLQVTDLAKSIAFYRDTMGLMLARDDGQTAWLRCSDKPYDLILEQGSVAGLSGVGFELETAAGLDQAFARIADLGYALHWNDPAHNMAQQVASGFRFSNPDTGLELDFYVGQAVAATAYLPTLARIERLGHVVINCKSYADAHRFWVDDLGFAISDHVPGKIAFLRAWPNPLHHSFALLEGPEDGLNHFNFMVTDIDDVGMAMNRLKKADVPIVFGPGRHLPSTSIFIYFLDPDGLTTEYSFGMEEIPEDAPRAPRDLEPRPEVLDTWGSIPDPRFGKGGVIVKRHA